MKKGKCFSACDRGQRNKSDFYQTPYSITEQLIEVEYFDRRELILDPAGGDGAIIKVLEKNNYKTIGTDIKKGYNFLKNNFIKEGHFILQIITNPPFSLADEFIKKIKEMKVMKAALLLPLNYLHGQKRHLNNIFQYLRTIYVFTRYPLLTDTIRKDGKYNTGMIVYAWYIFEHLWNKEPIIRWIDNNKYILKKGE